VSYTLAVTATIIDTDGERRTASLLPSEFFGTEDDPPTEQHMNILAKLFAGFTRLKELTIPLPDHEPTFDLLAVKSLTTLRLTHAQPTVDLLRCLSKTCHGLRHLEFTIYPFPHAFWILTHDALESYAEALAGFPNLQYVDLCASVHLLRDTPTVGNPIIFDGTQPNPNDISEEFFTPELVMENQRTATLILARRQSSLQYVVWAAPNKLYTLDRTAQRTVRSNLQSWVWRVERKSKDSDTYYPREYTARVKHDTDAIDAECEGEKERTASWDDTYHRMWSFR